MRRGEAWWVNFDPAIGEEIRKRRPAIIVSMDAATSKVNRLQVVPLTTNISRLYPNEAFVTLNGSVQKAMADQIMTVSIRRLSNQAGVMSDEDMKRVEVAMRYQLGLPERSSESPPS